MTDRIYTLTYETDAAAHPAVMAGACGLALFVCWLRDKFSREQHSGHFEVDLDSRSVTLKADERGLRHLYERAHAWKMEPKKDGTGEYLLPKFPMVADLAGELWAKFYWQAALNTYMVSAKGRSSRYVTPEKKLDEFISGLAAGRAVNLTSVSVPGVEAYHPSTHGKLKASWADWYALLFWSLASRPFVVPGEWRYAWAVPEVRNPKRFVRGYYSALRALEGQEAARLLGLPQGAALDYASVLARRAGGDFEGLVGSVHVYCWQPSNGKQAPMYRQWRVVPSREGTDTWNALRGLRGDVDFRRHIEAACFTHDKNPWHGMRRLLAYRSLTAPQPGEEKRDIMKDLTNLAGAKAVPAGSSAMKTAQSLMYGYVQRRMQETGGQTFQARQEVGRQAMFHLRGLRKNQVRRWVAANVLPRAYEDGAALEEFFALCESDPERAADYLIAGTAAAVKGRGVQSKTTDEEENA